MCLCAVLFSHASPWEMRTFSKTGLALWGCNATLPYIGERIMMKTATIKSEIEVTKSGDISVTRFLKNSMISVGYMRPEENPVVSSN